jgi:hypothetical protein
MKKYFFSVLSFFLILNFSSVAQKTIDNLCDTCFVLKHQKHGFSVQFPGHYKLKETKEDKGLKSEWFEAIANDEIFMFKYSEHKNPAVSGDNQVYMDASLDSFITGIKGSLIKKSNLKYDKTNCLEALVSINEKNLNAFYRVMIIDHVQYQMIVITKKSEKSEAAEKFFKSFSKNSD